MQFLDTLTLGLTSRKVPKQAGFFAGSLLTPWGLHAFKCGQVSHSFSAFSLGFCIL